MDLVRELPFALQFMTRSEREQVALLRAEILRQRTGTGERVLRSLGRWMDGICGRRR